MAIGALTGGALTSSDDMPGRCLNRYTQTLTIQGVLCLADAGAPTVNPIISGGGATSILSSVLTCGAGVFTAGTLNGTPTLAAGTSIDANIAVAGGTAKYIIMVFQVTLP